MIRVLALCVVAALGLPACSGGSSARPEQDAGEPQASTLEERAAFLAEQSEVEVWLGDLDGDAVAEVAFAPVSTAVSRQKAVSLPDLTRAVVLTHNAAGELVAATSNAALRVGRAVRAINLTVGPRLRSLFGLVRRGGACALLYEVIDIIGESVRSGVVAGAEGGSFLDIVLAVLGFPMDVAPAAAMADDEELTTCLRTPQSPIGCVVILVPRLLAPLCKSRPEFPGCDTLAIRPHCYQVPADEGTCPSAEARNLLCKPSEHPSGCCNADFIYDKVFLSDLRNQAPAPEQPSEGRMLPSQTIILRGDAITLASAGLQTIASELGPRVGELAGEGASAVLQGAQAAGAAGALLCLANALSRTHNPIQLTTEPGRCARNTALAGHVLKGYVDQCVGGGEDEVYSTIIGRADTAFRFGGLNETVGPWMLGAVRDHFAVRVAAALREVADHKLCCVGADVRGGSVDIRPSGGLDYSVNGEASDCTDATGSSDAGIDGGSGEGNDDGDAGLPDSGGGTNQADDGGTGDGGADGSDGESDVPPAAPSDSAQAIADPHLRTFDGLRYDMQAVGELTLVRDETDGLEVQIRTKPYTVFIPASVNIAVAARVGEERINVFLDGTVHLNGAPMSVVNGHNALPNGGAIYRLSTQTLVVVWPDNSQLRIDRNSFFMDVQVFLPSARKNGKVVGLLGDFDGSLSDDLATRAGLVLPASPSFDDFYRVYAESWRVTAETSLFDYEQDEDTDTFTDRSFPAGQASLADLSEEERNSARAACIAAGVADEWLDSCTLDVGISGDSSLADSFLSLPRPEAVLEVLPPLPASGISLADIVGGGDGSGTGSSQGINMAAGTATTTHLSAVSCPANTFVISPSPFVDGVFCPDGGANGTTAVAVSSSGLTLTGLPDSDTNTWDHLWNGHNTGVSSSLAGAVIGAHPNKGVTFDLDAIEASAGGRTVTRFVTGAAFGATGGGGIPDVSFILALDGVEVVRQTLAQGPNTVIPLDMPIESTTRFLTLITISAGSVTNDWAFWLEPRLFLDGSPDIFRFGKATESLTVSRVSALGPDANAGADGVFDVVLRGPVSDLVLYSVDATGAPVGGHQWDTTAEALPPATGAPLAATNTYYLGVEEDGVLLNPTNGSLAITDTAVHVLKVYAHHDGQFTPGRYLRLASVSGGGAVSLSPILSY